MGEMIKREINRHISQLNKIISCNPNRSVNITSLLERKYGEVYFQWGILKNDYKEWWENPEVPQQI